MEETIKYTGFSQSTLRRLRKNYGFPCRKIEGSLRFNKEEVDIWLKKWPLINEKTN